MDNYIAPEDYIYDENTGLYYTQIIVEDEQGNQSQVVNWFNAKTGEYTQNVYPIHMSDIENYSLSADADEVGDDFTEYEDTTKGRESFAKWIIIGLGAIILLAIIVAAFFLFGSNKDEKSNNAEQPAIDKIVVNEPEQQEINADNDKGDTDELSALSDSDGYVSDDIFGVYENDEMIVVVAPGVEHYQAAMDGLYDIGTPEEPGFWIVRYEPETEYIYFGTNVSLDNEVIIDYTENENGHIVDMAYGCMGEEMTYYEHVLESGQQKDILLKKTKQDPVKAYYYYAEKYNEMVKE